jgi:hypothetical protein
MIRAIGNLLDFVSDQPNQHFLSDNGLYQTAEGPGKEWSSAANVFAPL